MPSGKRQIKQNGPIWLTIIELVGVGLILYYGYKYFASRFLNTTPYAPGVNPTTGSVPSPTVTGSYKIFIEFKKAPKEQDITDLKFMIPSFDTSYIDSVTKGKKTTYGLLARIPITYVAGDTENFVNQLNQLAFVQQARLVQG